MLVGNEHGSFALEGARPPPEDSRDIQNFYPSHMRAKLFTPDTCGQMFRRATVEQVDVELVMDAPAPHLPCHKAISLESRVLATVGPYDLPRT